MKNSNAFKYSSPDYTDVLNFVCLQAVNCCELISDIFI